MAEINYIREDETEWYLVYKNAYQFRFRTAAVINEEPDFIDAMALMVNDFEDWSAVVEFCSMMENSPTPMLDYLRKYHPTCDFLAKYPE